jgi:hypothetical protein
MREAVNINLGLLALKKVVEALNSRASFVPYGDSKLTMVRASPLSSSTCITCCADGVALE